MVSFSLSPSMEFDTSSVTVHHPVPSCSSDSFAESPLGSLASESSMVERNAL
ncbi:hypothetical protein DsansV1_C35g0230931 [Dioscorea sansibarensis]